MTPVTVETTKAMIVTGVTTSRIDILAFMDMGRRFRWEVIQIHLDVALERNSSISQVKGLCNRV
jgi:hypothetical protein